MRRRFRLPLFAVAATLLGLIALLATLQYRWLGAISDAERERLKATLNARATDFAQDFDRELTRAYLLFQLDPLPENESIATRIGTRYDRWQATARFPRMIREVYAIAIDPNGTATLQRFNASTRFVEPADWPAWMTELRAQLPPPSSARSGNRATWIQTIPTALWDGVPAIVVPSPRVVFDQHAGARELHVSPQPSFTVVVLDRDYLFNEMMPALAQQHFRAAVDGVEYQVALVSASGGSVLYHTVAEFSPKPDAAVDASADLFQVRVQAFGAVAAEVRQFTTLLAMKTPPAEQAGRGAAGVLALPPQTIDRLRFRDVGPVSILVQSTVGPKEKDDLAAGLAAAASRQAAANSARWRLLVKHPAGSLERAVGATRRRNLIVSSSILGVLGASMGLLVLTTRRAQRLAQQQMEFVAAVSHELRTPLAVIRSAGDNLAEGVVDDRAQIKKYGELVRGEGRRLTEMVEQILEFAGIESGQRPFVARPVAIDALLQEVVASSASLIEAAGMMVEYDFADDLPAVAGDGAALRRAFQNLVGNAVKYGASGKWIGLRARRHGSEVQIVVADRGIGIAASEQARIFEPFYRATAVVAAQIQGAGLGLSLVQRIVHAHGGRIAVESAPGAGSEFLVTLPLAGEERVREGQLHHGAEARGSA